MDESLNDGREDGDPQYFYSSAIAYPTLSAGPYIFPGSNLQDINVSLVDDADSTLWRKWGSRDQVFRYSSVRAAFHKMGGRDSDGCRFARLLNRIRQMRAGRWGAQFHRRWEAGARKIRHRVLRLSRWLCNRERGLEQCMQPALSPWNIAEREDTWVSIHENNDGAIFEQCRSRVQ